MITLSVDRINSKSPYKVTQTELNSFQFTNKYGNIYIIGFAEELMFDFEDVYQLFILDKEITVKAADENIEKTVLSILEEFFSNKNVFLDYICDTSDSRQAVRNRLFKKWLNHYKYKSDYYFKELNINIEGTYYFAAILYRKNNINGPTFLEVVNTFRDGLIHKFEE